jgi:hypothetical protein
VNLLSNKIDAAAKNIGIETHQSRKTHALIVLGEPSAKLW